MSILQGKMRMRRRACSGEQEVDALRKQWSQWTAIVELFAWRRGARRRVDPQAYGALRREIIAACRSLAQSDPHNASRYRSLEVVVRPWLNPRVLNRTERELLLSLLARCRDAEAGLSGRSWQWSVPRPAVLVFLGALAVAALFLLSGTLNSVLTASVERLRDWTTQIEIAIKWSTDFQRVFFLGSVLLVVSMFAIMRTKRN